MEMWHISFVIICVIHSIIIFLGLSIMLGGVLEVHFNVRHAWIITTYTLTHLLE